MKTCTKCGILKNFSDFHKYQKSMDGHKHHCKLCVREFDQIRNDVKRVFPKKEKDGLRHCRNCNEYLDKSKFWGNYTTYCKECRSFVGHSNNLKKKGLTVENFMDMSRDQDHVCMICKKPDPNKRLSVDHDHSCCPGNTSCGKCTRGLLCSHCNKTLGMVNDDVNILQDMIDYLQK
jgi:hypothetical protein